MCEREYILVPTTIGEYMVWHKIIPIIVEILSKTILLKKILGFKLLIHGKSIILDKVM